MAPLFREYPWRLYIVLMLLFVFSSFAVIPYAMELQQKALQDMQATAPVPVFVLILLQVLFNSVLFGIAILFCLLLALRMQLQFPLFDRLVYQRKLLSNYRRPILMSIALGAFVGLLIFALDLWVFQPLLVSNNIELPESLNPAWWKGLLASFYGGFAEEMMMRLCLLTFLAWLGRALVKDTGKPRSAIFWTANILIALVFGLGHLPATAAAGLPLTPLIVARALVLNGIAGIVFGWLYWYRGLGFAMLAHFFADIVLHVFFPLFT